MNHSALGHGPVADGWVLGAASKSAAVALVALLVAVVSLGLDQERWSFACGGKGEVGCPRCIGVRFVTAFTDDDGKVDEGGRDPWDSGVDPGYEKRVGRCQAQLIDGKQVRVVLFNTYPSYTCRFWLKVKNVGSKEVRLDTPVIAAPPELTLRVVEAPSCTTLYPGKRLYVGYSIHVEQSAERETAYPFAIEHSFSQVTSGCSWCPPSRAR